MTRVLVVEDDPQLVRALVITLRARGYDTASASDGATALDSAAAHPPDVVLLDLGLPDMSGVAVLRALRERGPVPVVVVSARRSPDDKVAALDAGADDYVTKPFSMDELLARMRAAARRGGSVVGGVNPPAIATDDFTVDLVTKRVVRGGHDVRLTPTEWHILEILVTNPGRLVGGRELLHEVWGPSHSDKSHYLRVYLAQLRRKLEPDPPHPRYFITEPGRGYRFEK
ncbi:response regulator transcription factor [Streptomyces sp. LE64]|jgi:two-component system, OmpR family, KDP operon response regulator KdpE|uniref:response regulator transcription factor n=1 Tax=unclassified Streptomyces TaxID=2593676 RepID=UPI003322DEB1